MSRTLGGLGLVDFEIKDKSLKVAWIRVLQTDDILEKFAYAALSPQLQSEVWICNLDKRDVLKIFKKSFWTDVLEAWCEINHQEKFEKEEILNEFIWYNSKIRVQNKPILIPHAFHQGLRNIAQLCNIEGGLLPVKICCQMFGLTIMEWNMIISALPKSWIKYMNNCTQINYTLTNGCMNEFNTEETIRLVLCSDARKHV